MARSIRIRGLEIGEGLPKICIPLVACEEDEIFREAAEVKRAEPDMVEWRIDRMGQALDTAAVQRVLAGLREIFPDIPLLATFRTVAEGGACPCSPRDYEAVCRAVVETGLADLLDVEYSAGREAVGRLSSMAHAKGMYVIISAHDFSGTPGEESLLRQLEGMTAAPGDMVKLAVMPRCASDVAALLHATARYHEKDEGETKTAVTMSMGELGCLSRLCGELTGSAVTFGCVSEASAPGQVEARELRKELLEFHRRLGHRSRLQWKENLFLIGFMGTGKSAVARAFAGKYGMQELEMDEQIVREEGMTIAEIFAAKGEEYFRGLETGLLMRVCSRKGMLVSCGGGVPLREENVEWMRRSGKIVLLTAEPQTILERVKDSTVRPLLNGHMDAPYIEGLMERRREYYEEAADYIVSTDGKSVEEVAGEIWRCVTEGGRS